MPTSHKIDFTTLSAYAQRTTQATLTQSYAQVLTVDVSKIPTGAKFSVSFSAKASGSNTATGFSVRSVYNSVNGQLWDIVSTWGKTLSATDIFTKVSGQNTVILQSKKDNSTECNLAAITAICTVIG